MTCYLDEGLAMSWHEFHEFLQMGGYGAYVWSAYGVAAVVLTTNALLPVFRFRALRREIERGGGRR